MAGDKSLLYTLGGQYTCSITANSTPNTQANSTAGTQATGAGRLCKVILQSNTVNTCTLYDNTGPAGAVLFIVPNNTAAPQIYNVELPFANGIFVNSGGAGNSPAFAFSFNLSGPNGQ